MHIVPVIVVASLVTALQGPEPPTRDPAIAADGRLAVSVQGDLWVRSATGGNWVRLTSGPAWDHSPAWQPDGRALVFVSDRNGTWDLFQVDAFAAERTPQVVIKTADQWESEPAVAVDGSLVFVRGRGSRARLWIRSPDGAERRLTAETTLAERWPALAPEGRRIAYVRVREGPDQLRVLWLDRDSSLTLLEDREVESPAWSPGGDRIAFSTRTGRAGVWVTPARGGYVNLVTPVRARAVWSSDGRHLIMAALSASDLGYNGDPDRQGERDRTAAFQAPTGLWMTLAPPRPDDAPTPIAAPSVDRRTANAARFDAVWQRTAETYFHAVEAGAHRAAWDRARERHRERALAATTDEGLEAVVFSMLKERPPLREPARGWAAVSSAHPVATEAGLEVLRKGGNVVDAAVAVSFALGVVEPDASGMGGYGEMLIGLAGREHPELIEFMSRAPEEAALSNAGLTQDGRYPDDGPVLAMVPGTVAAMDLAWQKHGSGRVPWAELIAPAVRAAEEGFVVSDGLATTLAREEAHFLKYPGSRALFFPGGRALQAGDTLRNPDLAWSLRQVAAHGARAFYDGEIARRMVSDLRGQGSALRPT
ncbi:MAG TPA: gamma-glutamyltransferase, partial [Gemmatimonadales bacterium]|nr:gamma-glutamyltransferase [Gemmatimonadales bacterium]